MITDIADAGFEVLITELDVDPPPRDPRMYGADLAHSPSRRVLVAAVGGLLVGVGAAHATGRVIVNRLRGHLPNPASPGIQGLIQPHPLCVWGRARRARLAAHHWRSSKSEYRMGT
jgi:hypothetical protein